MTELQNDPAMLKLIDYTKNKDRVSYEEVHDFLPDSIVNSDKIEEVIAILAKHNVTLEEENVEKDDGPPKKPDGKKKRIVLVAAAGNWGSADRPAYPAAYKEVVAVTAFSEERRAYSKANRGQYIDFAAPGVQIYTAVPRGGRVQSGTSFASPYIAVLVALELQRDAKKTVDSLRKALRSKVVDLGNPGKDNVFGWGFVDKPPSCR